MNTLKVLLLEALEDPEVVCELEGSLTDVYGSGNDLWNERVLLL